jgi:hypothetical protein
MDYAPPARTSIPCGASLRDTSFDIWIGSVLANRAQQPRPGARCKESFLAGDTRHDSFRRLDLGQCESHLRVQDLWRAVPRNVSIESRTAHAHRRRSLGKVLEQASVRIFPGPPGHSSIQSSQPFGVGLLLYGTRREHCQRSLSCPSKPLTPCPFFQSLGLAKLERWSRIVNSW